MLALSQICGCGGGPETDQAERPARLTNSAAPSDNSRATTNYNLGTYRGSKLGSRRWCRGLRWALTRRRQSEDNVYVFSPVALRWGAHAIDSNSNETHPTRRHGAAGQRQAGRGDPVLPGRDRTGSAVRGRVLQPGERLWPEGDVLRGHPGIQEGHRAEAGLRARVLQPRVHPPGRGPRGEGHRLLLQGVGVRPGRCGHVDQPRQRAPVEWPGPPRRGRESL
mmetsp:Transcript_42404/g.132946  ORF Transcript_42404/g.132946 Transcript_42404/m.132946 type:complete len:222 (-) Transcript_42404:725-1390(-)